MPGLDSHNFYDIGYSHDELKHLLNKIEKGQVLTESDYNKLIKEIGLNNISTFSGNYNDLENLPNFDDLIREVLSSLNLPTDEDIDGKIEFVKSEIIEYMRRQLENKSDIDHKHSLADIDTLNTILSLKAGIDHLHDEQYYTKAAIDKKIEQIQSDGFDGSNYATLEDLSKVNELLLFKADKDHLHDMNNINGLEDELNKKADKDSLNEMYKKEDVYNKTEIDAMLENSVDGSHKHDDVYTKEEVDSNFIKVDELLEIMEDTVTKEDLSKLQADIAEDINKKADVEHAHDNYANKEHTHNEFANKEHGHNEFNNFYTKEEVDDKILDILEQGEGGDISIDLGGYVKKSELDEALTTKADMVHTHDELANKEHSHDEFANKEHTHEELANKEHTHVIGIADVEGLQEALDEKSDGASEEIIEGLKELLEEKADINHEHEEYALENHVHTIDKIEGLQEILNDKASVDDVINNEILLEQLDNKADKNHSHEEFANKEHVHEDLAKADHGHDEYAEAGHTHEGFANEEHTHDEYSQVNHKHDEYALEDHSHDDKYAPKTHEHTLFIESVMGLQTALDERVKQDHVYSKEEIDKKILDILEAEGDIVIDLEGYIKQSQLDEAIATKADAVHRHDEYAEKEHNHNMDELEGMQELLDEKANVTDVPTNEDFSIAMSSKAELVHSHEIDDITDLKEELDKKANVDDLNKYIEEDFNALEAKVNSKADVTHSHDEYALLDHAHADFYYTKEEVDSKLRDSGNAAELLAQANAYTDTAIAGLVQNAPEGMDTFSGIAEAVETKIETVNNSIETMETAITSKADAEHIHTEYVTIEEIEGRDVFETDQLTVNAVGGIASGTDLNGLTVKEVLNKLLFPYVAPTISAQGTPNGGTFEKGDNKTITNVKVVVTKKSEKITKLEVLNGSTVLVNQTDDAIANGGTFNYTVSIPVNSTNVQLTARVTDATGATRTATTGAFTFIYPYYVGVCSTNAVIDSALVKSLTKRVEAKGTKTINYTTNNQRMIIAYPKSYGSIAKILDPNSFDVTSTFERIEVKVTCLDGTTQTYYVYVNGASSVDNFAMKFNY